MRFRVRCPVCDWPIGREAVTQMRRGKSDHRCVQATRCDLTAKAEADIYYGGPLAVYVRLPWDGYDGGAPDEVGPRPDNGKV